MENFSSRNKFEDNLGNVNPDFDEIFVRRPEEHRHKSKERISILWRNELQVFLSIPENRTKKYPKPTSLQHFEVDISRNFQKSKFLFFSTFSKFCLKKISILWHSGHFNMFLCRSLKTALKNTQNSSLYSILKVTFLEIFKNERFCVSQFSRNFFCRLMPGAPQVASHLQNFGKKF